MSYVSLLKNLPEILSQPTGIAAIASVGIHGAIALIVPLVPVDSNKTKESASSKPVGVMELSQADQNRLPQIPGSSPILPPSPVQLQQSQLPQFNPNAQTSLAALPPPPAPNPSQLVLPPIPTSPNNYGISPLPKQQSLGKYSRKDFGFDTSFKASSKFSTSTSRFNNREIALGEGKPLTRSNLPVLPEGKLPDGLPTSPTPLPINVNPGTSGDITNTAQTTQPGNNAAVGSQNGQPIVGIQTTPQVGDNLTIATQGLPQGQLGSGPNLSNQSPASGTAKAIAQIQSYEELRKTVQQQYPNAVEKTVIRDTITDKSDVEGVVLGRLVVGPEGVSEIKFEGSSTPALQIKAREYFKANPPKREQQIAHYPFSLEFKNNSNNATGDTQKPGTAATLKPLLTPAVNNNQPAPASGINLKPSLNTPVNNNQPAPASGINLKPSLNTPVNNNQPAPASQTTGKPLSNSLINRIKPVPAPRVTVTPFANPVVNTTKPVSTPATTVKPLVAPASTPAATVKPLAAPVTNTSQPTPAADGKKLIQQLRELRQERETSNQDK
ncbi:hypothetical protein NIES2100_68160 [Calothrix sp. NIES-2100]|uniref:hypothetical protein n=1 Tax=Calothrix sp. NIES-2100 TaxID=1954172 RepID=UPI000B5F4F38|nr:hypothetical protein NIES2100_68160 [Calothrix sp. NIES-2100]